MEKLRLNKIYHGDALEVMRQWPAECVDMCVTSPPYWGLRDYGVDGQLGLEKTPEEYIEKLVAIFREVRRVLRPWSTAFLNMGDCHANEQRRTTKAQSLDGNEAKYGRTITGERVRTKGHPAIKDQELCGIPGRLIEALQADGWWRKSDIVWHKPGPMTESMQGWRWEQHKIKVGNRGRGKEAWRKGSTPERMQQDHDGKEFAADSEWKECHGCSKCEENDGLVLRKGSGRPTRAYEYIYMLANEKLYFYDSEAVKQNGANLRNVWVMQTANYPDAHYATFPEELPKRCILAGTSHKGNCAECGRPWVRVVEKKSIPRHELPCDNPNFRPTRYASEYDKLKGPMRAFQESKTLGWRPSCACKADTVPAIVLDPFFGSGTTGKVATDLGRNWLGIDINPEYIEQAKRRTAMRGLHETLQGE